MYHMFLTKMLIFFRKNSPSPRAYTSFKTLISNKNCSVTFDEISYVYVSKGSLSIGGIKFWGKVAKKGGGRVPLSAPEPETLTQKFC